MGLSHLQRVACAAGRVTKAVTDRGGGQGADGVPGPATGGHGGRLVQREGRVERRMCLGEEELLLTPEKLDTRGRQQVRW